MQSQQQLRPGSGHRQAHHPRWAATSSPPPPQGPHRHPLTPPGSVFAAALPKVMINVRTSVQTVMIGNSVEFECQALGDPEPTVRWSKVGGSLPAHIMVKGGMLKIDPVTEADAGQYRCTATNDVGSVQSQVVLNVQCEWRRRTPETRLFFVSSHLVGLISRPSSSTSSSSNFLAA